MNVVPEVLAQPGKQSQSVGDAAKPVKVQPRFEQPTRDLEIFAALRQRFDTDRFDGGPVGAFQA